jgi:hypothetical protein
MEDSLVKGIVVKLRAIDLSIKPDRSAREIARAPASGSEHTYALASIVLVYSIR